MQHFDDMTSYYIISHKTNLNSLVGCSLNNCLATMSLVACSCPQIQRLVVGPFILGMLPTCPRPLIVLEMSPRWRFTRRLLQTSKCQCARMFSILMKLSYQQNFLQVEQIETRLLMTHP